MPFQIIRNDIAKMQVDAVVSAADTLMPGGGGVDGPIHAAAGPELLEEYRALGGCGVGRAIITAAYRLPCRYVIHTVGPKWHGGLLGERRRLASCYRSALELAKEHNCETVAFPLISAGSCGYPKDKAVRVAVNAISAFLLENDMMVFLVLCGQESLELGHRLSAGIREYIDSHYVERRPAQDKRRWEKEALWESAHFSAAHPFAGLEAPAPPMPMPTEGARPPLPAAAKPSPAADALDDLLFELDESFQQMLLRKIDERGMTDAQCYKKANIDRKLFSKIRKDTYYKPSKSTALAFAIALELDLRETESLLRKAGYALSRSSKFDVIVQYFIERKNYNIFEINEALFYYDQNLLGV